MAPRAWQVKSCWVGPARPANTFRMEGLLAELRELQPDSRVSRQPRLGPAVAALQVGRLVLFIQDDCAFVHNTSLTMYFRIVV